MLLTRLEYGASRPSLFHLLFLDEELRWQAVYLGNPTKHSPERPWIPVRYVHYY
jgi:hypothetical protein